MFNRNFRRTMFVVVGIMTLFVSVDANFSKLAAKTMSTNEQNIQSSEWEYVGDVAVFDYYENNNQLGAVGYRAKIYVKAIGNRLFYKARWTGASGSYYSDYAVSPNPKYDPHSNNVSDHCLYIIGEYFIKSI